MKRRQTMRCALRTNALVASASGPDRARVRDISLDGMAWSTERRLREGCEVEVLLSFALGGRLLRMKGEVIWSRGTRGGIRFTARDPSFPANYFNWCRRAKAVSMEAAMTPPEMFSARSGFTPRARPRIPTLPPPSARRASEERS